MTDSIRHIVAIDGLRLANAYGVLALIERDAEGRFCALRAQPERFDQRAYDRFVTERRITPLVRPIETTLAQPALVYFDSTNVFHGVGAPSSSDADRRWRAFFGAWAAVVGARDVTSHLPGFEPRAGVQTERALLLSRASAHACSARLAANALAVLERWDAEQHAPLQPLATWRLLQWLEFSVAYSGPLRTQLSTQLSAWLLAVARTGRVPSVRLDRLDRLVAMDFSADTAEKIRRRAKELHDHHFSSNARPRPPQRRAA